MAKSVTFCNDLLNMTFINGFTTGWATSNFLYVAIHTTDPSLGNQSTGEISYTGYARQAVIRTSAGWSVSGASTTTVADILFPAINSGTAIGNYVSIGVASAGAGEVLYSGAITGAPLTFGVGDTPRIVLGKLTITEA